MCGRTGETPSVVYFWPDKDIRGVLKYHMALSLYSQSPPPPAPLSHPLNAPQTASYCPLHPAGAGSPTGEVTFSGDTEGERCCQWWIIWLPPLFKRLLCHGSLCAEAAQTVTPAFSLCGSAENNEGGSLSHMSLNAHKHPAAEQFKRLWWRCFGCVGPSIVSNHILSSTNLCFLLLLLLSSLYLRHILHVCLSWKRNPACVAISSFFLSPDQGIKDRGHQYVVDGICWTDCKAVWGKILTSHVFREWKTARTGSPCSKTSCCRSASGWGPWPRGNGSYLSTDCATTKQQK